MRISLRTPGARNASTRAGLRRSVRSLVSAVALFATVFTVLGAVAPDAALAAPKSRFTPARKVGRGFANTTLGFLAIPGQMVVQTRERGAAAGLPIGFGLGIGWFVASELIGVWEILTCPFEFPEGYKPILEPEFPWEYFEE
jgi:putative exosortase-associated protein (TIGR04073 family)